MRDIDRLLAFLPNGEKLDEDTIQEIIIGNATIRIDWNEDGSIKTWGILD